MNRNPIDGQRLVALKERVEKYFNHTDWMTIGTLTNNFELIDGHSRLLRSMNWGDDDYGGCVLDVLRTIIFKSAEHEQLIEQYLDDKYPQSVSGERISSHNERTRVITFAPLVFKIPDEAVDPRLVSVMMPINAGTTPVYAAIRGAVSDAGLHCERADNVWEDSVLIQDIFSLIFRCKIVVCDFSGKNPNVFYEAGIAHTLGKHVIPITQADGDIPFDLNHHRYLKYLSNTQGLEGLRKDLSKRLTTLAAS